MFRNDISPAMARYAQIEAGLNQGKDPVGNGALKGIEAAKSSLSLSPLLRRPPPVARAISGGAAAFQPPAPGTGRAGMLQSIAQAMGPAMQEYYKEMDTRQALELEMAAREQKQQNELAEQAYRQSVLGETSRHHQAMEQHARNTEGRLSKEERQAAQIEELQAGLPQGAVPIMAYGLGTQSELMKDLKSRILSGTKAKNMVEIARQIKAETNKYPDMSTDYARALLHEGKGAPGFMDVMKLKLMDKDKKASLEKVQKLKSKLILNHIEGKSGKLATDMLKTFISNISPGYELGKEAIDKISDDIIEEYQPIYRDAHVAREAIKGRYYVPPHLQDMEELPPEESNPISDRLQNIRTKFPQFSNPAQFPDEVVLKWAESRGI